MWQALFVSSLLELLVSLRCILVPAQHLRSLYGARPENEMALACKFARSFGIALLCFSVLSLFFAVSDPTKSYSTLPVKQQTVYYLLQAQSTYHTLAAINNLKESRIATAVHVAFSALCTIALREALHEEDPNISPYLWT